MPLTVHESFHLDSMLAEQIADKADPGMIEKLRTVKGKTESEYLMYLDAVKVKVDNIFKNDVFPGGLEPSDIHDFLEKE